jgi:hypothetical protein
MLRLVGEFNRQCSNRRTRPMKDTQRTSPDLTPEQQRIVRSNWEWAGRYALFWIIVALVIFGLFLPCWTMAMLVRAFEYNHLCSSPR